MRVNINTLGLTTIFNSKLKTPPVLLPALLVDGQQQSDSKDTATLKPPGSHISPFAKMLLDQTDVAFRCRRWIVCFVAKPNLQQILPLYHRFQVLVKMVLLYRTERRTITTHKHTLAHR